LVQNKADMLAEWPDTGVPDSLPPHPRTSIEAAMTKSAACRTLGRLVLVVGLAMALSTVVFAAANTGTKNLIDLHAHSGQLSNKDCLACHAKITSATTLDRKTKTFHSITSGIEASHTEELR
jgi:hypothetical protein